MKILILVLASVLMSACGSRDENGPPQVAEAPAHGVKDPVCGMIVDPKDAPKSEYKGKTYYFCSREDKERFDKAPAEYIH